MKYQRRIGYRGSGAEVSFAASCQSNVSHRSVNENEEGITVEIEDEDNLSGKESVKSKQLNEAEEKKLVKKAKTQTGAILE